MVHTSEDDAMKYWLEELREVELGYLKTTSEMVRKIVGVLFESLGVKLDDPMADAYIGARFCNMNFYPPCPNPDLTVGAGRHSDMGILTVLLQDGTGGLYVKMEDGRDAENEGEWVQILPVPGALVINVGDSLQYVKADNDINNQPSEREEATSVTQPLAANFSSIEIESGGSLKCTQSSRGSSNNPAESSNFNLSKIGFKDQDDSISKSIITDLRRTGDPTQDMLDLFLGPLLKKPQNEEKKIEITTEEILAYEFKKQSESKNVESEVVSLVKKKSSLKDKISMFLD